MGFIVKDKNTGKIISPRNYYFVIKQNGELYTTNGKRFDKAKDRCIYEILNEPTTEADTSKKANELITDVSKLFLFKVQDYTTELVGRYNKEKDCYYVQRGDGSKYEYDAYRVTWKQELNVC